MGVVCVFFLSFFFLFFPFPWKSSDHNCFQWGWNFDIDCQQGSKLSSTNFITLKYEMNAALIWREPDRLSDLIVFKVPADLETGFVLAWVARENRGALSLALRWKGDSLRGFTPLCGVNFSLAPSLPCAPPSIGYQQSSTWGQCQVFNWNFPWFKKSGNLNAKDYYSKVFLLLFFSVRTASLLHPSGEYSTLRRKGRRSRVGMGIRNR